MNLFKDSAIIITLITAALYSIGTAFSYGLFSELNIDPSIIERNFHQILYSGAINLFNTFGPAVITGLLSCIATFLVILCVWPFLRKIKIFRSSKIESTEKEKNTVFTANEKTIITYIGIFFILLFVVVLFQEQGEKKSKEFLEDLKKDSSELKSIHIQYQKKIIEVIHITCGTKMCVGVLKKNKTVLYYNIETIMYSSLEN